MKKTFSRQLRGALFALVMALASGANAFTIRGTIENGTTGAKNVSARVVVVNPSEGMEEQTEIEAREGRFEIPNLDPKAPMYLLRVEYAGVSYSSPVQVTGSDQDIAVTVYETTTSWDGIGVVVPHLAASRIGDHLQIEQLFEISNQSSPPRTLNGEEGFFHLYLPSDMETLLTCFANSLGVPIDQTPIPTDTPGRYRIAYPVRPGTTRVGVAYTLPYAAGRYTLSAKVFHDIAHVTVFGVDSDIRISSTSHTLEPMEPVHGMSSFSVHDLKKGSEFVLTFEGGNPEFTGTTGGEGGTENVVVVDGNSEQISLFLMAALLLTLAGMTAVALRDHGDPLADPKVLRGHYDALIARLARLDDFQAAGAIPDDAYRSARDELVAKSAALAVRMRGVDGSEPASNRGSEPRAAHPAPQKAR